MLRILRLDVPAALKLLAEMFPAAPDPSADRDYAEPAGPRAWQVYARDTRRCSRRCGGCSRWCARSRPR